MSAAGPTLRPGDAIEGTKYRVVKQAGVGGMGVVYQVVKPPNILGVLKLMSTELAAEVEHRTRFFDEVRILAQLDHPNIVKVFDYDALPDGTPFYVMELLSGRTVRDVIWTLGRVPPRVAYEITRQLLEALQCAHTHEVPVIHRDIKPENIFLHAPRHGEPTVKLIDFGVSAVADRQHDEGEFVGTWSYAAPEQIRGERPTPATDLYATGLVLYEMLAGAGPFDHLTTWPEISAAQLRDVPPPVSKLAPWVPASIVELVASALAKDPALRPRDAYAFAERLFELEWASDGNDARDVTIEGPSGGGQGPLSRVLSTVTRGGSGDATLPNASVLLDGLAATPRPPSSQRERIVADAVDAMPPSPRPGQVIIQHDRTSEPHALTTPRRPSGPRDTFSSQAIAAPKPTRGRAGIVVAIALSLATIVVLLVAVARRGRPVNASSEPQAIIAPPVESVVASVTPTPAPPPPPPAVPVSTARPAETPRPAARPQPSATPSGRNDYMRLP